MAAARRFVRRTVTEFGMESVVDDAMLITSELATNAVVHAGTGFEITVVDLGQAVRVEVHDRHPARELPAAPPSPDSTREGGRGLLACSVLASSWGVEYGHQGKTIWCRLDVAHRTSLEGPGRALGGAARGFDPEQQVLVGVISTDAEERVRGWNADAEALLGWSAEQVLGRALAALRDHTADLEAAPEATAGPWQGELDLRHRDGHFVRVFVSRQPYTESGSATLLLVVPARQRAVLQRRPGADEPHRDRGGAHWAAFSRAEVTRLPLDDLLRRAVQRACDAVEGDAAYIVLVGEDGIRADRSASTGLVAAPEPGTPVQGNADRDRLPVVYDDLDDTALPGLVGTAMRSAVSVPMAIEGRLVGQLVVASTTPGCFDNHDAMRMQQAADHLALSVESCRISETARRHRGWLGYLADASELLAGTLDPRMTLAMLAQLVVPSLATWCVITTRDAHGRVAMSHVWHADETRLDEIRSIVDAELIDHVGVGDSPRHARVEGHPALHLALRARGRGLGGLVLGDPPGGRFDQDTVELAEELSRRAALTLDNALLYRNQLAASEALQRSLLPARLPDVPLMDVGVAYHAAGEGQEVGGDFYDLFQAGPDRWRFTVGDVCGSGPEAAAVTGQARHVLRVLGRQSCPVADAVHQLNDVVREDSGPAPFLTLLHGEMAARPDGTLHVEVVAAGHPLPYLLDPSGWAHTVGTPQTLLGVVPDVHYTADQVTVLPGQSLLCVTDGVLERRRGARMFGEGDFEPLLRACAGLSAAAIASMIQRSVIDYTPEPALDDIAILVLRRLAAPVGPEPDAGPTDAGPTGVGPTVAAEP